MIARIIAIATLLGYELAKTDTNPWVATTYVCLLVLDAHHYGDGIKKLRVQIADLKRKAGVK